VTSGPRFLREQSHINAKRQNQNGDDASKEALRAKYAGMRAASTITPGQALSDMKPTSQ